MRTPNATVCAAACDVDVFVHVVAMGFEQLKLCLSAVQTAVDVACLLHMPIKDWHNIP